MNIDYKEKYLKYKSKYLLAKSLKGGNLTKNQQAIVKKIVESFVSETKLDTHNIQYYMDVIGENATLLTKQKIELLFDWSVLDEKTAPVGFGFETAYKQAETAITDKMVDEKTSDHFNEALRYIRNGKENIIEDLKNQLYNKLLSKIFDDSITIEQFTKLANETLSINL